MTWTTWLLLAAIAALLLALLGWWRASTRMSRANRARQVVARAGEVEAERLLSRQGFTILDRQQTAWWSLRVDGEPVEVWCRADLLVERAGVRFVAEVKTGARAPDPTRPATRRQLLEYLHAFEVDGVLLVDVPAARVVRVEWD